MEQERGTKVDKEKHIEGAEARCESLVNLNKEANQKLAITEQRLQTVRSKNEVHINAI